MSNKIEIEFPPRGENCTTYKVSHNGKFADQLTFDEMLGLVASLTMPASRPCTRWLKTQEEWDHWEKQLTAIRERNESQQNA